MYLLLARAIRIAITHKTTKSIKKKIVPEKNGNPKELTNITSKNEARDIEPGMIPSCINPKTKTEINAVKIIPLGVTFG